MLKNNRWFVLLFIALLLFLGAKACSPVPVVPESKCMVIEGIVADIQIQDKNDIVFTLKDDPTTYYLNRGLEKGYNIEQLKSQFFGQKVAIKYPRYWTPLDPFNHNRHISKMEYGDSIVFSEVLEHKRKESR